MSGKDDHTVTEKLTQLDEMVAWFDSEDFELEQALERFTQAEKLAAEIENDLLALKNKITVVKEKFDRTA